MKRNTLIETPSQDKIIEYKQRISFHEAGHAAGIHLNNKAMQLPQIFFKIIFKDINGVTPADIMAQSTHDDCIAHVEGGRLIELLPPFIDTLFGELTEDNTETGQLINDYTVAFEADIINLLIGPLAEAKYIADTDDELFNQQLINLKALKNYGGSDLALANDYLHSYSDNTQKREKKLDKLFTAAFNFINKGENWAAITHLANYIFNSSKNIINCDEVISILDQSVAHFQNQRTKARVIHYG